MATAAQHLEAAEQLLNAVATRQVTADQTDDLVAILIALTGAVIGLAYELGVPAPGQAGRPTVPASSASPA